MPKWNGTCGDLPPRYHAVVHGDDTAQPGRRVSGFGCPPLLYRTVLNLLVFKERTMLAAKL